MNDNLVLIMAIFEFTHVLSRLVFILFCLLDDLPHLFQLNLSLLSTEPSRLYTQFELNAAVFFYDSIYEA